MVGLGDTKKKIQKMIDAAEDLYAKMNELRSQVEELRAKVDQTSETVAHLEHDVEEQRALLAAIAEEQGIDVDEVLADAAIEEVDPGTDDGDTPEQASADGSPGGDDTTGA